MSLAELIDAQSGGDVRTRLQQVVQYKPVKEAATEHLSIHLRFDPKTALDVRSKGNFTNKQLALLRTLGVHLPRFYDIKDEQATVPLRAADCRAGGWSGQARREVGGEGTACYQRGKVFYFSHLGVAVLLLYTLKSNKDSFFKFFFQRVSFMKRGSNNAEGRHGEALRTGPATEEQHSPKPQHLGSCNQEKNY